MRDIVHDEPARASGCRALGPHEMIPARMRSAQDSIGESVMRLLVRPGQRTQVSITFGLHLQRRLLAADTGALHDRANVNLAPVLRVGPGQETIGSRAHVLVRQLGRAVGLGRRVRRVVVVAPGVVGSALAQRAEERAGPRSRGSQALFHIGGIHSSVSRISRVLVDAIGHGAGDLPVRLLGLAGSCLVLRVDHMRVQVVRIMTRVLVVIDVMPVFQALA